MDCDELGSSREYSALGTVIGSLPYAVMVLLGAAVIALGRGAFWWAWIGAGVYVAYGVLGALWLILFLCPYCRSYGTRSCPSGYGVISAKLRARGDPALFRKMFRRHIPIITPLWIIPPIMGGVAIACWRRSWPCRCGRQPPGASDAGSARRVRGRAGDSWSPAAGLTGIKKTP